MKRSFLVVLKFLLFVLPVVSQVKVQHLLTENLVDPVGIDIQQPRFSWQILSDQRNVLQSAYEIKLSSGKKNEWRTGKVLSDQSVQVPYQGSRLQSGTKYNWQVRVWDNKGKASAWSVPATFQMALLNKGDWKAKWIGAGFEEDSVNRPAQYFRKQFPVNKKIKSATAFITAH
ncbi:MAG: glycoside hydrolase family 78 protein, partial [Chitinophagaceae bacterium]